MKPFTSALEFWWLLNCPAIFSHLTCYSTTFLVSSKLWSGDPGSIFVDDANIELDLIHECKWCIYLANAKSGKHVVAEKWSLGFVGCPRNVDAPCQDEQRKHYETESWHHRCQKIVPKWKQSDWTQNLPSQLVKEWEKKAVFGASISILHHFLDPFASLWVPLFLKILGILGQKGPVCSPTEWIQVTSPSSNSAACNFFSVAFFGNIFWIKSLAPLKLCLKYQVPTISGTYYGHVVAWVKDTSIAASNKNASILQFKRQNHQQISDCWAK